MSFSFMFIKDLTYNFTPKKVNSVTFISLKMGILKRLKTINVNAYFVFSNFERSLSK